MSGFRPINENRVLGDSGYEEDDGFGYDPENAGVSRGSFSSGGGAASKCKRMMGCVGLTVVLGGAIGGVMYGYLSFGPDGAKGSSASAAAAMAPAGPSQDLVQLCSPEYISENTDYDCGKYCQDGKCCFMPEESGENCNLDGENAETCDKYSPCSALLMGAGGEVSGGEYYDPNMAQENQAEGEGLDEYEETMEEEYEYEEAVEEAEEEYYEEIAEEQEAEGADYKGGATPMDKPPAICSNGEVGDEKCSEEKVFCVSDDDCKERTQGEFSICSEACGALYEDSLRDDVKGIMEEIEDELPKDERLYCAKSTAGDDVPITDLEVASLQCFEEKQCVEDDDCDTENKEFCDPRCGAVLFGEDGGNGDDEEKKEPLEQTITVGTCGSAEPATDGDPVKCDPDATPCMTAEDCTSLPSPFNAACVKTCPSKEVVSASEMFCGVKAKDESELSTCTDTPCQNDSDCDGESDEVCLDACDGSDAPAPSTDSFFCGQALEDERDCDFKKPCKSDSDCESPFGCLKECLADFNDLSEEEAIATETAEEIMEEEVDTQIVPGGMPPAPGANITLPEFPMQCVKVVAGELDCAQISQTCESDDDCDDKEMCSPDCGPTETTSPKMEEGEPGTDDETQGADDTIDGGEGEGNP